MKTGDPGVPETPGYSTSEPVLPPDVPVYRGPSGNLTVEIIDWSGWSDGRLEGGFWVVWRTPCADTPSGAEPPSDKEMRLVDLITLTGTRNGASPRIKGIADGIADAVMLRDPVGMPLEEAAEYAGGYDAGRARRMAGGPIILFQSQSSGAISKAPSAPTS